MHQDIAISYAPFLYKNAHINIRFYETVDNRILVTRLWQWKKKRKFSKSPLKVDIYENGGLGKSNRSV